MSASKSLSLTLIAALSLFATLVEARDASSSGQAVLEQVNNQVQVPDEARIATDLKQHALFAGISPLQARPGAADKADWTTVRSSVREGDVLEFRVTSIYRAESEGGPQHEVDSIISYQREAEGWKLISVSTEDTRHVVGNRTDGAGNPC